MRTGIAARGRRAGAGGRKPLQARKHLHERVTRQLGLRILDGSYGSGDTIPSEVDLCAELGVSRTALREAIKLLSSKGLVTPRVKVGTIVNPRRQWNFLDPVVLEWLLAVGDIGPFLKKLFALRQAVEPAAAALAARNATFEDFETLHTSFQGMAAAVDDFDAWVASDLRFHQAIYEATGNELFWPVGRLLEPALLASFRVTSSAQHHHQHCIQEHRDVYEAILARNPDRAYRAVVALMQTTDADLSEMLDLAPGEEDEAARARPVAAAAARE
jgi:DNA-binding FadR family transcriptional regulator